MTKETLNEQESSGEQPAQSSRREFLKTSTMTLAAAAATAAAATLASGPARAQEAAPPRGP